MSDMDMREELASLISHNTYQAAWGECERAANAILEKFDVTAKAEPVYAIRWHYSGNITDTGAPIEDIRALKARYPDDLDIIVKVGDDWENAE